MATESEIEETELSDKQKVVADHSTAALDGMSELGIEMATITKDDDEGQPVAACILILAGPEKTMQVLNALAEIEESWDEASES